MMNLALQLGRGQQLTQLSWTIGALCYLESLSQNLAVTCAGRARKTVLPSSKL